MQQLGHGTALVVEVLFLLSPLVHGVNFFDFHPEALAVPTLLIMLIGLVRRRWLIFAAGLVLSLMMKEDVIAALAVFGGVMLVAQYVRTRKIEKVYLVILLSSIAVGIVAIVVARMASGLEVSPMLGYGSIRYSYLDKPPLQLILGALGSFFQWGSIFLFFSYFWPLGFLPLLSPLWAAPALFILATGMLASEPAQKTLHQYPAAAIPFLFMALIATLAPGTDRRAIVSTLGKTTKSFVVTLVVMLLGLNFLLSLQVGSLKGCIGK